MLHVLQSMPQSASAISFPAMTAATGPTRCKTTGVPCAQHVLRTAVWAPHCGGTGVPSRRLAGGGQLQRLTRPHTRDLDAAHHPHTSESLVTSD
jgi:hypothetical protein